jgi:DNA primase
MPWIDYREVRRRIPMSRVLELLHWEPDRHRGDQLRGPCPIHAGPNAPDDRRPVLAVHLGKQVYFCHACRSGGDPLRLWQQTTQRSLYAATLDLCRAADIEVPWLNRPTPADENSRRPSPPQRSPRNR